MTTRTPSRRKGKKEPVTQRELPAMPPKTKADLQADRVADLVEQLASKKGNLDTAKLELASLLRQETRPYATGKAGSGQNYRFTLEDLSRLKVSKN